ncbi:MAG: sugar 3,4-ketoisomerase [Cytophagaceae bacterium]
MTQPSLISFKKIGDSDSGFISVAQFEEQVPFDIKRIFWIYDSPEALIRGNHAHRTGKQVIIPLKGEIEVSLENSGGETNVFVLKDPNTGLLVPEMHWLKIKMEKDSVLLCISSMPYDEKNYMREKKEFFQK